MSGGARLRSGPPPTPTETLKRRGSQLVRKQRRAEPKGVPGLPPCPAHLGAVAAAKWAELAPQLEAMRVVQLQDASMLEALCVAYEDARTATTFNQRDKAWRRYASLSAEFGLSPAQRAKVRAAAPEKPKGGLLDLIAGGKRG